MVDVQVAGTSLKRERTGRFILNYQARVFVHRLYNYFKEEYEKGVPLKRVSKVTERVSNSLQICRQSVTRVLKESRSGLPIKTPGKKKLRLNPVSDPFTECAVRNHIFSYYERKVWPNRIKLLHSLKIDGIFQGERAALSTILKNLGFKWRTLNKRKRLLENSDMIAARCLFIHTIQQYDIKKIIFIGESYINVSKHVRDGGMMVLHAGNAYGFLPNCCLLIKSDGKLDPRQVLTAEIFNKWFIHQILENIPEKSVLVMDNAPHHSVLKEKIPSMIWCKGDIQNWLTKHNIDWSPSMLKGVLLDLVNSHKALIKRYELDVIAEEKGHIVIRLPVKHSEFNPTDKILSQVKEKIALENTTNQLDDVEKLTEKAISSTTVEDWQRIVEHTGVVIEEARIREEIIERNLEEMLGRVGEHLNDDSASESESSETDEDEDAEYSGELEYDITVEEPKVQIKRDLENEIYLSESRLKMKKSQEEEEMPVEEILMKIKKCPPEDD